MTEVTDTDFEQLVLKGAGHILVVFSADWCGHCRVMRPAIEQIAQEMQGKLTFLYCNVDHAKQFAARYNIQSIPTLIMFCNGEVKETVVGAKPKEEIEKFIGKHLA